MIALTLAVLACLSPGEVAAGVPSEELTEIAQEVGTGLSVRVDSSHADDGMVAFHVGEGDPALVTDPGVLAAASAWGGFSTDLPVEAGPAYLAYRFQETSSGLRYTVGYAFRGTRFWIYRPKLAGLPELTGEVHKDLVSRAKRRGLRVKPFKGPPGKALRDYVDSLTEGEQDDRDGTVTMSDGPPDRDGAPGTSSRIDSVIPSVPEPGSDDDVPRYSFVGDDDAEAAIRLREFLQSHGVQVKNQTGSMLAVTRKDFLIVLQPVTVKAGLDRLIAAVAFVLREGVDEEAVIPIASKLNEKTQGLQYSVRSGNLLCQVPISFVDQISLAEIEAGLDFMIAIQLGTFIAAPELAGLLER